MLCHPGVMGVMRWMQHVRRRLPGQVGTCSGSTRRALRSILSGFCVTNAARPASSTVCAASDSSVRPTAKVVPGLLLLSCKRGASSRLSPTDASHGLHGVMMSARDCLRRAGRAIRGSLSSAAQRLGP